MNKENIIKISKLIFEAKKIAITSHFKPDGDSIGSEVGFALFLKYLNKEVKIINEDPTPQNYNFLTEFFNIELFNKNDHSNFLQNCDLIFTLDVNRLDRFPALNDDIKKSKAKIICIDHHTEPELFFSIGLINENSSATGELIYELISSIDKSKIDKKIATSLYTAILTDSGSFKYRSTTKNTHLIVSDLLSFGASPNETFEKVYEQESLNKLKLIGEVLSKIEISFNGKVAVLEITKNDFTKTQTTTSDVENIINFGLTLKGIKISILFSEIGNNIKVGFRSKDKIPVNLIAKEFGGGGHLNASSAILKDINLDDAKNKILKRIELYLNT